MTTMHTPTWTTTPTGERETTWHGEIFHLAKEGRFWYLHRGPASTTGHSLSGNAMAGLWTTVGGSADMAALILNGWSEPVRPGEPFTHRGGTTRNADELLAELKTAPAYTPARGEDCLERALGAHHRECTANRVADTCPVRTALAAARRADLIDQLDRVVDAHPDVRWLKPAASGQIVVHFMATDDPRITGGIGFDPHHRPEVSPWQVGAQWTARAEVGHRARATVRTAAQLAEEITRQVERVRAAVAEEGGL